jgi:hypothetical protein
MPRMNRHDAGLLVRRPLSDPRTLRFWFLVSFSNGVGGVTTNVTPRPQQLFTPIASHGFQSCSSLLLSSGTNRTSREQGHKPHGVITLPQANYTKPSVPNSKVQESTTIKHGDHGDHVVTLMARSVQHSWPTFHVSRHVENLQRVDPTRSPPTTLSVTITTKSIQIIQVQ